MQPIIVTEDFHDSCEDLKVTPISDALAVMKIEENWCSLNAVGNMKLVLMNPMIGTGEYFQDFPEDWEIEAANEEIAKMSVVINYMFHPKINSAEETFIKELQGIPVVTEEDVFVINYEKFPAFSRQMFQSVQRLL